jgi:hypothetical protein
MKHLRYILLATALASGAAVGQQGTGTPETAFTLANPHLASPAHAAAVQALHDFTAGLRPGQALPPGFPLAVHDDGQLRQAHIGWGFAVYDVEPASLRAAHGLASGAQPIGQWRYAIVLRGKPVGLLTLERTARGWEPVSFGGAGLGREIDALVARYGNQAGTRLRYVRVPQATADFIEVRQGTGAARYAPLRAARESLRASVPAAASVSPVTGMPGLLDEAELVPGLRQLVARSTALMH